MGRNMLTENGFEHYFRNASPADVDRITNEWDDDTQWRFADLFNKSAHLTDREFGEALDSTAEVAAELRRFGWGPMVRR